MPDLDFCTLIVKAVKWVFLPTLLDSISLVDFTEEEQVDAFGALCDLSFAAGLVQMEASGVVVLRRLIAAAPTPTLLP